MSQDRQEWIAGRVELMLDRASANTPTESAARMIASVSPYLREIIIQGVSDTLDIHTETLQRELDRAKTEREMWYQQTLEHQAKLDRLMIESGK